MRAAIVTAATGHGHLSAARALAEAARSCGWDVVTLDVGSAHRAMGALVGLYNLCLRRPPRWMGAFFAAVNASRLDRLAYRLVARWAEGEVLRLRPGVFLSVHPMVNYGIAEATARAGLEVPLAVVLTDLAPPFWRGWAEPRAAAVTAPTAEAAHQLAAWGVPPRRILRAPIPVRPAFRASAPASARHRALRELGLAQGRLTVVLSAGTACRRSALRAYRALAAAPDLADRLQTVVLAGRDPAILERARRLRAPFPSAVVSWRDDPETILAAADLLFTKPGGLTASEAMAAGVSLLLDACGGVMPQERGGARWIAAHGAGWIVESPGAVPAVLRQVTSEAREAMRERVQRLVAGDARMVWGRVSEALELPRRGRQRGAPEAPARALALSASGAAEA